MREILYAEKSVKDENETTYRLLYYVTVNEIVCDNFECEGYGVKIVMEHDNIKEFAKIDNIFVNSLEIEALIVVLSTYTVMPQSLSEVLDDYLAV